MTFVPLKNINFVNTKVELSPLKEYKYASSLVSSDILNELEMSRRGTIGEIKDLNNTSKSILSLDFVDNIESHINTSLVPSQNKELYVQSLNNLLTTNSSDEDIDILEKLDNIKEKIDDNDNSYSYNSNSFRNTFKIKRLEHKFSYDAYNQRKNNIIKDNLYKYYRHNKDIENLRNINWGFSNYNTINFYSQFFDSNRTHSNCIVYPNLRINSINIENTYDFINSDSFNISFYIIKRKEEQLENPGCIIHIPGLISVYLVNSTNRNISGNIKSFKLQFAVGSDSYNQYNSAAKGETEENILNADYWGHFSINFIKKANNSVTLKIYKNGVFLKNIDFDSYSFYTNNSSYDSYICLGNKPKYLNNLERVNERNRFFAECFSQSLTNGNIDGPYFKKHIEFGEKGSYILNTVLSSINDELIIKFDDVKHANQNSEALNAEICDIRIYKKSLSSSKIISIFKNSIAKIEEEENIDFYLPVYYVPKSIKKSSLFNASGQERNLRHTSVYNTYFANFCGGYEVNVENFLIEFVNKVSPNIIIGGSKKENIYGSEISNSVDLLINYNIINNKVFDSNGIFKKDAQRIEKGETCHKIYLDNIINSNRRSDDVNICNLSYLNNLILPNDNGLQNQNHEIILETFDYLVKSSSNFIEDFHDFIVIEKYFENSISANKKEITSISFVSKDKFTKDELINYNFSVTDLTDFETDEINLDETIFIDSSGNFIKYDRKDELYNIDKFLYNLETNNTASIFSNVSDKIGVYNTSIDLSKPPYSILKDFSTIYEPTKCNVLNKDFKNSEISDSTIIYQIDTKSSIYGFDPVNNQVYNNFLAPYKDFNKYYFSFSNIIEISNQFYNKKIEKNTFELKDYDILGTNEKLSTTIKDNGYGCLYRSDCKSKVADWNYIGHIFYNEGLSVIHHPGFENVGYSNFKINFRCENTLYVNEINIPCESGVINESNNSSYNRDLRSSESSFDQDEEFVYITDINLHDENLNIVAKAKLAQPVAKKNTDNILFRLKMDY